MKSHYDYNVYTPELVAELRKLVANVPRAEGVKRLMKRLDISERNSRRQYAKYIESDASIVTCAPQSHTTNVPVSRKIRRLFYDIETSPNVVLSWRIGYKINLDHSNVLKERSIICIGYKWEGDDKVAVIRWDEHQDDKAMLSAFIKIFEQADEVIGHNIDRFDLPWVRTRCLFHNLPPLPTPKSVDTLKICRSKFYFNSNRLDYVAKYLGIGGKLKTEFGLWKDIVLNKDAGALKRMTEYCGHDVILLEKVWKRLYDLVPPKTHVGVMIGNDKWTDPRTGSENVSVSKTKVSAAGTVTYQMRNRETGSYYSISATAYEAYCEAKGRGPSKPVKS